MGSTRRDRLWPRATIVAGIALLSACSGGGSEDATPTVETNPAVLVTSSPTSNASTSAAPSPTIAYAPADPNYPDIPMHDEVGLDPASIGEGWFLVEYRPDDGDRPSVNFLIDPEGEMYRTTTYVFPEDTYFSLWLGDVYWFNRATSECYECSPIGDVLRGVFSTGSVEKISSGYLVGPLEAVADGGVRVTYGEIGNGFNESKSRVVSLDGISIEGDSYENASETSPDGTRRVLFKGTYSSPSEVYVETVEGVSTKIADFTYPAMVYNLVGWKDDDELYFYRLENQSGYTPSGPRMDFILNVDTGDVTPTTFTADTDAYVDSFLTGPSLFAVHSYERQEANSPSPHTLLRPDGTIAFSRTCTGYCKFTFSGDRALLVEIAAGSAPGYVSVVDRLTLIDLETGATVQEIDLNDTGWFELIPYGANHW